MTRGLSKDIIFLVAGILLSFALESQRQKLNGLISPDNLSLACLALFALLTGGYIIFHRYHNILTGCNSPEGSSLRKAYDNLRNSLSDGGNPAQLYAVWLERTLHVIERFFLEEPPRASPFIQQVIGLSRPACLWTAPALDKCILISFIYPQALLILGWGMTGKAGPAEQVLGLMPQNDALARYLTMTAIAVAAYAYIRCYRILAARAPIPQMPKGVRWSRFIFWQVVVVIGSLVVDHYLGNGPRAVGGAVILTGSVIGAVANDVLVGVTSGLIGAAVGMTVLALKLGTFAAAIMAAVSCSLVGFAYAAFAEEGTIWCKLRARLRHSPIFWWSFLALGMAFYFSLARYLAASPTFLVLGPILLYYGLLPSLNAPFLWFAVGLTRAFLWLGLEKKGLWPYIFALVDAAASILGVVVLVAVMVIGVQTLNLMATQGGGEEIFPLKSLLSAVTFGPQGYDFRAENWWAYTVLFLALVPSLINLAIGGFSLLRGIPSISSYLHRLLPEGHAVAPHDRNLIALVLSIQAMVGLSLAFAWQFLVLPWWIFGYVMPGLGLGVLKMAQAVATLNLPAHFF